MKNKLLSTSLKLLPSSIQYMAMTKALNYLFHDQPDMARFDGVVVSFKLTDLRRVWTFSCDGKAFSKYNQKTDKVDVTCSLRSDVALSLMSKQEVIQAVDNGQIEFSGDAAHVEAITALVRGLQAYKIAALVDHSRHFLRLKPIERPPELPANTEGIDLATVTASDLDTPKKVDFIRDMALAIESMNLQEALRLMTMAKIARPNGPKICQKVAEYEAQQLNASQQ